MLLFLLLFTGDIILQFIHTTHDYTSLMLECSSPRYTCQKKKNKTRTRARIRREEAVNYSRVPVTQLTRTARVEYIRRCSCKNSRALCNCFLSLMRRALFSLSFSFLIIFVKVEPCARKLQISSAQSILLFKINNANINLIPRKMIINFR